MKKWIAIVALALLNACAFTSYTRMFGGYGYNDVPLSPDRYRVTFAGYQNDVPSKAADQALLRSAELTLTKGYRYFVVVEERNDMLTSSYQVPATQTTETTSKVEGNETKSVSTTTYNEAKTVTQKQPATTLTIQCFHDKPAEAAEGKVYDAQFLWTELGPRYGVKRPPKG
ncbi:hypothetical protein CDL60_06765 [Roseateles noduli]|nr:hypothetical protein CDL60_06765 [Roseateles noduli]